MVRSWHAKGIATPPVKGCGCEGEWAEADAFSEQDTQGGRVRGFRGQPYVRGLPALGLPEVHRGPGRAPGLLPRNCSKTVHGQGDSLKGSSMMLSSKSCMDSSLDMIPGKEASCHWRGSQLPTAVQEGRCSLILPEV